MKLTKTKYGYRIMSSDLIDCVHLDDDELYELYKILKEKYDKKKNKL